MSGAVIYTIGHSNQTMESFLNLLTLHRIDVVVDVRSYPFARYAKQFDTDSLKDWLVRSGFKYLFLGKELGGKPREEHYYDDDGNVLYAKLAAREEFQQGIKRLIRGSQEYRIALCCGEENPTHCHRRKLIAPALAEHGLHVEHIRGSGITEPDELFHPEPEPEQLRLF